MIKNLIVAATVAISSSLTAQTTQPETEKQLVKTMTINKDEMKYSLDKITRKNTRELSETIKILNKEQQDTINETLIPNDAKIEVEKYETYTIITVKWADKVLNVMIEKNDTVTYSVAFKDPWTWIWLTVWDSEMPNDRQQKFYNELNTLISKLRRKVWG